MRIAQERTTGDEKPVVLFSSIVPPSPPVHGRVCRDFSAVGKSAGKTRDQKNNRIFPKTIPLPLGVRHASAGAVEYTLSSPAGALHFCLRRRWFLFCNFS